MNCINALTWNDIKTKVRLANESLYQEIERVEPDPAMLFFVARYDFGEHFGVRNDTYLPTSQGTLEKIDSSHTDNELFRHLGYGEHTIPLSLILDKFCEWHYIGEDKRLYPDCVQGPGAILNMQIIFDEHKTVDNNVLSASSGALSSYLLPNIGCRRKHARLHKYFKISCPAPKTPYDHYDVFKDILSDINLNVNWQSEILYFSEAFVNEVKTNEKWLRLKLYFSESLRKKLTQNTYDASCNDLFLSIKSINRFRPTPFIIDTAKYIFNIAMGSGIGVKPATNDQYFPVREIQKVYNECYGLEYTPTLMVPASLNSSNDIVYYPLQCPFSKINTFKTNQSNSTLNELEMLKNVLLVYQKEFTQENNAAFGSSLYHISKQTEFTFYHYQATNQKAIYNPLHLLANDPRFAFSYCNHETAFSSEAKLFRGCIRLSRGSKINEVHC